MAAASLAQVHRARLLDGTPVVIKMSQSTCTCSRAPGRCIMLRFADLAERRFTWARSLGVADLIRGLVASLREELDYRREAANTTAAAAGLAGHPTITTPTVYPELVVRERVLVLQRFEGELAADGAARLQPQQRQALARDLMSAIVDSTLVRGVFHADLHPGNVMLLTDDLLGLLDFGAVGVLDAETRQVIAALLMALVTVDNVAASTALTTGFQFDRHVDESALRREVGRMITLVNAHQVAGVTAFNQLFVVLRSHGVVVPGT